MQLLNILINSIKKLRDSSYTVLIGSWIIFYFIIKEIFVAAIPALLLFVICQYKIKEIEYQIKNDVPEGFGEKIINDQNGKEKM